MSEESAKNSTSRTSDPANVEVTSESKEAAGSTTFRKYFQSLCSFQEVSIDEDELKDQPIPEKISWASEWDLVLNCIGFSVGLGNLWRFPHVAYRNGGGAFLIPYIIVTCVITFPLYYMELLIGQCSSLDPITVWSFCPIFRGIGIAIMISIMLIQTYYNVLMAYALFYVLQTFRAVIPWSKCFEWWGANDDCYEFNKGVVPCYHYSYPIQRRNCTNATETSSNQFWRIYVLDLSSGLEDPGTIKWDLALMLLITWVVICILVFLRHHSKIILKVKTIYFTALFPFLILAIYFVYVISLPGAKAGLAALFIPNWSSLLKTSVWSEALQTSLYSAGLGMGGLIVFGSRNKFNYNTFRCASISIAVDMIAGVLAATVTFMVVGYLAAYFSLEFSEASLSGHGLVFVTFPDALINMSVPHLWSFLFFSMLFVLAIDASVAVTETLALGIRIFFCPANVDSRITVVSAAVFLFFTGLSCVTNGGSFVVDMLDLYAGGHSLLGIVMLESVAFGWGYGIRRISQDIETMQGSSPYMYMKVCWVFIAPVGSIVLFIASLIENSTLTPLYKIPYPAYADTIGSVLVGLVLVPVPICAAMSLIQYRKSLFSAFKPGIIWKTGVFQTKKHHESERNV